MPICTAYIERNDFERIEFEARFDDELLYELDEFPVMFDQLFDLADLLDEMEV